MAKGIAKLAAILSLNSKPYTRGMKHAETRAQKFRKTMKMAGIGAAAFGATIGIGVVRALQRSTAEGFRSVDAIGKTAAKLGVSTEALRQWQFTADQAGVNAKSFNVALQRMTRRASDAGRGQKELRKSFRELNINVDDFLRLTPDQRMYALADAFRDVKSQSDRVRLAFKLFDTEGVQLVNMLQLGSAALEKEHDRARRLGLTFRHEGVRSVEAFNDSLSALKQTATAVGQHLAIHLADPLKEINDQLLGGIERRGGVGRMTGLGVAGARIFGRLWSETLMKPAAKAGQATGKLWDKTLGAPKSKDMFGRPLDISGRGTRDRPAVQNDKQDNQALIDALWGLISVLKTGNVSPIVG